MGLNIKAITNIQRQVDILSDGHQEVVDQAVSATEAIRQLDDRMEKAAETNKPPVGLSTFIHLAQERLSETQEQLTAQASRAIRVRNEIEQIKTNLRII